MSTKIYPAYEFVGKKKDMASVLKALEEVKVETEEKAKKHFTEIIARIAQERMDMWAYYGTKLFHSKKALVKNDRQMSEYKVLADEGYSNDSINIFIFWELEEAFQKHERWMGRASVMIFPLKDRVLAMTFGHTNLIGESFDKYFEDYHYQNQSDRPDDITAAEWRKRERDWDKVLGNDYIPNRHGFAYEFFNTEDVHFQTMVDFGNDYRKEAARLAAKDVAGRVHSIRETLECPLIPEGATWTTVRDIQRSDEYKKWAERKDRSIAKKLGLTLPKNKEED